MPSPSTYLADEDLATYGVPTATRDQILQATGAINAYLRRPDGLVVEPDYLGRPCYIEGKLPSWTLTATAVFLSGTDVTFTVSGPVDRAAQGDVLIVDRSNGALTEAVTIKSVDGNNITIVRSERDHDIGAKLDAGLVFAEQRRITPGVTQVVAAFTPIGRILSMQGRTVEITRRNWSEFSDAIVQIGSIQSIMGPPAWQLLDIRTVDIQPQVGSFWFPVTFMPFEDVQFQYIAGFLRPELPWELKQATANAVKYYQSVQGIAGSIQTVSVGGARIVRFENSIFDDETKIMLSPYRARLFA